jgi:predicted exporter
MIEFFEHLSFGSAALLVAAQSFVAGGLVALIKHRGWRWGLLAVVPWFIAYCVYWMPVWFGRLSAIAVSEYHAWVLVYVGPLTICGWAAASVSFLVVRRLGRTSTRRSQNPS